MRRKRIQQLDEGPHRLFPLSVPRAAALQVVLHRVGQLHQEGDRRVEAQLVEMLGDLAHRLGHLAAEDFRIHACTTALLDDRLRLQHQPPDPLQKLRHAVEPGVRPLDVLLRRADEHLVKPPRVRPLDSHQLLGRDAVAQRLRHHLAEPLHHPLVEKAHERLGVRDQARVVQHLHEKARVQQVQDRVLDAARVLIHGHPVVHQLRVERLRLVVRAGVAQEVPGRVDEGVHGVGLAPSFLPSDRTGGSVPIRLLGKRFVIGGQRDRQLLQRHRDDAVSRAVDDRDGRAPISLARDQPVAQTVLDRPLAGALCLEPVTDPLDPDGRIEPVELTAVDQDARPEIRLAQQALRT